MAVIAFAAAAIPIAARCDAGGGGRLAMAQRQSTPLDDLAALSPDDWTRLSYQGSPPIKPRRFAGCAISFTFRLSRYLRL